MAVMKNEIPILEYDSAALGMLRHDRREHIRFPKRAVLAFLMDKADDYGSEHGCEILDVFETVTRNTNIYNADYQGQELCLCRAPLGAAAAVQLMDWLIGHGVEKIIAVGSCGALTPLPENHFLIPVKAMRDEGISYHYLPPQRYVETSPEIRTVIKKVLDSRKTAWMECTTWTTDGFFRETPEMVAYRRDEGCAVVEMECAGMAACAQFRGVQFGQLLYTADTLAEAQYDERGWGLDSLDRALMLALEIGAGLP